MKTNKLFAIILIAGTFLTSLTFAQKEKQVSVEKEFTEEPKQEKNEDKEKVDMPDTSRFQFGNVHILIYDEDANTIVITDSTVIGDSVVVNKEIAIKKRDVKSAWCGWYVGAIVPYISSLADTGVFPTKSISSYRIGLLEKKLPIIKDRLSLVTGLGVSWNTYKINRNTTLIMDSNYVASSVDSLYELISEVLKDADKFKKNNLISVYLEVPLLVQLNYGKKSKHVSAGVVGGWRMGTWYKQVYTGDNGERMKAVTHNNYHQNDFSYSAMLRWGGKLFDIYTTYDFAPLFKQNEGPVLNNFTIGLAVNL